ncbi:MAG TPA: hypothetical protein VFG33_27550 [Kribbella sp.]|uniref:hypothetical protein n=1 Tax=Kribbella sp. TaxID=1871183 RepID=UPI002D7753E2|nr:hypothetical protein [Kribbella sp.]HET6297172.1 hypothetical protein [Kribbella sp.]
MLITPDRSLHYVLDTPLVDVIGISCLLRIRHPQQVLTSSRQIIRLGDAFELGLEPLTTFQALVRVRLQGRRHDLGQLASPNPRFAELRFDWHTSGKTYLRVDGRLVGYHDALSPGARLMIDDVAFGFLESVPPSPDPSNQIGRFFLRALRRRPPWPCRRTSGTGA